MHNPYPLRGLHHLSATAIRAYCECEVEAAYTRNFVGAPTPKEPVARVYGTAVHKLLEMTGKHWWKLVRRQGKPLDSGDGRKFVGYGRMFVEKVLTEKWGARGANSEVLPLLWPFERERAGMTEIQWQEKLREEIGKYQGRIYNSLEAFRLTFTVPMNVSDMRFELDFTQNNIVLNTPIGPIRLHGQIDRLQFEPDGSVLYDYKSGWIVNSYKNRKYIVEDLQMTIYHYVKQRLDGVAPTRMYIQPLEFKTEFLKEHREETLRKLAIAVPDRSHPEHIADVVNLGQDVWEMVDMVVRAPYFSQQEREEWQPKSSYGNKAGFADSVRQARFVPRIGDWCANCAFVNFCRDDHREDWLAHERQHRKLIPLEEAPIVQILPMEEPLPESDTLFPKAPARSVYLSKPSKELKNRMLASKNFVAKSRLVAVLNKVFNLMRELGNCPCVEPKMKLYPIWILPYIPQINREHVSLAEVCKNCPFDRCPRAKME